MKVVYVAGPFRAATPWLIEQNVRRAEEAALQLWQAGIAALCPHTMTRYYQYSAPDSIWLDGTLELMRRCDAVLVVSEEANGQESIGTLGEVREAYRLSIPVYHSMSALIRNFVSKASHNQRG